MSLLNLYLLSGLVLHKIVWEVLKRKQPATRSNASTPATLSLRIVKAVKLLILLGIAAQTVLPTILPLSTSPLPLIAIGVSLYTAGLSLAIRARFQLGKNWSDIEVGAIRKEHHIVETGVYRHIRHPIYVGDLALLVGLELALNSWLVVGAIALVPLVLRKALVEERKLRSSLPGYSEYCSRTRAFIGLHRAGSLSS